jgi:hypothetical protein
MDDVQEKFQGLLGLDRHDWPSLNPFSELVNDDKQVRVAPGCFLEGADQIKPPDRKWPHDGIIWSACWYLGLSSLVLAPFGGAHDPLGTSHRC